MFLQYLESEGFEFRHKLGVYQLVINHVLWDGEISDEVYQVEIAFYFNAPAYVKFDIYIRHTFNSRKPPIVVLEYWIPIENRSYWRKEFNFTRMLIQKSMVIVNKMRPVGSTKELANALEREDFTELE